jgi:hypothetical protein
VGQGSVNGKAPVSGSDHGERHKYEDDHFQDE